jgi:hypothetical protein
VGVDAWRGKEAKKYKEQYNNIFLTESCYRSRDREIAQNLTSAGTEGLKACCRIATVSLLFICRNKGIEGLIKKYHIKKRTPEEIAAKPTNSFCR